MTKRHDMRKVMLGVVVMVVVGVIFVVLIWLLGCGLSYSYEIKGKYAEIPPSFEEIEQDWSAIYYDIIPLWISIDERRNLEPLTNGNFLLQSQSCVGKEIEAEYHKRKESGHLSGSYPYNGHLWTYWNPSEEAVELREQTGHWPNWHMENGTTIGTTGDSPLACDKDEEVDSP